MLGREPNSTRVYWRDQKGILHWVSDSNAMWKWFGQGANPVAQAGFVGSRSIGANIDWETSPQDATNKLWSYPQRAFSGQRLRFEGTQQVWWVESRNQWPSTVLHWVTNDDLLVKYWGTTNVQTVPPNWHNIEVAPIGENIDHFVVSRWPPPAVPAGTFRVAIKIDGLSPTRTFGPGLFVRGASGGWQFRLFRDFHPEWGSGVYDFQRSDLDPLGPLKLLAVFSDQNADDILRDVGIFVDPVQCGPVFNPDWQGSLIPASHNFCVIQLKYPDDFHCHLGIALDCPEDNATWIRDGKLWVGPTLMVSGPGPGVPPAAEKYLRGAVPPGSHAWRFEHPRYALPSVYPTSFNRGPVFFRVNVQLAPPPVEKLEILGDAFYVDVGQTIEFRTNLPATNEPQVQWISADVTVLKQAGLPNRFQGVATGLATVHASFRDLSAQVPVAVRESSDQPVQRPLDPTQVETDAVSGALVVKGEVVVTFNESTSPDQRLALMHELGLSRLGFSPGLKSHQLGFSSSRWQLHPLLERLQRDPRVAEAYPNVVLSPSSASSMIPPYTPAELGSVSVADTPWHLHKMEAFPAYGLMVKMTRNKQNIIFVDTGLSVSPPNKTHADFEQRIDLARSASWESSSPISASSGVSVLADPDRPSHGDMAAGAAVAAWDNSGEAVGIDPKAGVVILKCKEGLTNMFSLSGAIEDAGKKMQPDTRVLNLTYSFSAVSSMITGWWNQAFLKSFRKVISQEGLIVIAAGNKGKDVANVGLVSMSSVLNATERSNILVVGGTQVAAGDFFGVESRWITSGGGDESNYDSTWSSSSTTSTVELAAPAWRIRTTESGHQTRFRYTNGTSFGAPLVSGVAAVLFSVLPAGTPASEVKQILVDTSDPIAEYPTGSPPPTQPRLHTEPNRGIGLGRVNMWQALLFVLNKLERDASSSIRYVGLRVTADQENLKLWLDNDVLVEKSVKNSPTGTMATRVTLTNKGASFPKELIARTTPTDPPLFRGPLSLELGTIDGWKPRFVRTLRMYTQGKVRLEQEENLSSPSRFPLSIINEGIRPTDPELLDPQAHNPWDRSLRKWMKLADGDAYALSARVLSGPPGVRIEFLNEEQRSFPASQVDDEQRPYVTVPFKQPSDKNSAGNARRVYLEALVPPGTTPSQTRVQVIAESLNNRAVQGQTTVTVVPAVGSFLFTEESGVFLTAEHWFFYSELKVSYLGANRVQLRVHVDIDGTSSDDSGGGGQIPPWFIQVDKSFDGWFGPPSSKKLRVWVRSLRDRPVGFTAKCLLTMHADGAGGPYHHQFEIRVGEARLAIGPPESSALRVTQIPGGDHYYADHPVKIRNDSIFPIRLHKLGMYVAGHDLGPITYPHPDWQTIIWDATTNDSVVLQPGAATNAVVRLFFDRQFVVRGAGDPAREERCWLNLSALDPLELPATESEPGPASGWSNRIELRTTLRG